MPRSGWLALGVVAGALAGTTAWLGQPWLGQPLAWAALVASWATIGLWRAGRGAADRPAVADRTRLPGDTGSPAHGRPAGRVAGAVGFATPPALVVIGLLLVAMRVAVSPPGTTAAASSLPAGSGPWSTTVDSVGSPSNGEQTATLHLEGELPIRVAAHLPRFPVVTPGDRIAVAGAIEAPPEGDYGEYLRRSGIAGTIRSRTIERLPTSTDLGRLIARFRASAGDALEAALPEPEAGLAAGIVVGLRERVDRTLAAAFTSAGVSHIVAISGWNIAIVAAVVAALLRTWPRRRRSVVALLVIAAYTVLTGASASVVRAAVMAVVVTIARESGRAGSAAAALGWAAVLMLLLDPDLVGDAGFQLSSLATAGLIAWGTPMTRAIQGWRGGRVPAWLAESLGVSFAAEAATLPVVLIAFGRLAIIAPLVNLLVVPLVPAAMAGAGVALIGGWLGLLGLPAPIPALIGLPAWIVLALMDAIVRAAAGLPFASATLEPPWNLVGSVVAVTVVGLVTTRDRLAVGSRLRAVVAGSVPPSWPGRASRAAPGTARTKTGGAPRAAAPQASSSPHRVAIATPGQRWPGRLATARRVLPRSRVERLIAAAVAVAVIALVLLVEHRPDGQVHITILDVGQGDSILVDGGRGSRMLIDGGPDPDRLLIALDARLPPWDRRIDLLVLTHPHEDHVAGLPILLERYRVGRVVEPGMLGPGPGYAAWSADLAHRGIAAGRLATGDRFEMDGIGFRVLWPDPTAVPAQPPDTGTGINNVSIVLLGERDGRRMLLMGDVEEGIDPILIGRGLPRVDMLKVAHHGSRTSSSAAFLAAVRPAVAVVSAGLHNPYGHPSPDTIGRLTAIGAEVFRTDLNGSVEVTLGRDAVTVQPARISRTSVSAPVSAARVRSASQIVGAGTPDDRPAGSAVPPSGAFTCSIILAGGGLDAPGPVPPRSSAAGAVPSASDRDLVAGRAAVQSGRGGHRVRSTR